jgi:hypothetical protein
MHILKMFWDTMGCTKKPKDLSEAAREDMGDMERYWDIMEGVEDIMGKEERDWAIIGFFRPNYEKDIDVVGHHRGLQGQVGVPVVYMDITKGSRAKLSCFVGFMDITNGYAGEPC